MPTEMLLLIIMFSLSVLGFINAINSHGTVRIILSYILATSILIASIITAFKYESEKSKAKLEAEKEHYQMMLKKAELENKKEDILEEKEEYNNYKKKLSDICQQGIQISQNILNINVDDMNADWENLMKNASYLNNKAQKLKKESKMLDDYNGQVNKEQIENVSNQIEQAMTNLSVSGYSFYNFFRAETAAEEDELYDRYKVNAKVAKSKLYKALQSLK